MEEKIKDKYASQKKYRKNHPDKYNESNRKSVAKWVKTHKRMFALNLRIDTDENMINYLDTHLPVSKTLKVAVQEKMDREDGKT